MGQNRDEKSELPQIRQLLKTSKRGPDLGPSTRDFGPAPTCGQSRKLLFLSLMPEPQVKKAKPDIRAITRLVPPSGNLVQGQSELPIDTQLAKEAAEIIAASHNHYGG